MFITQGLHQSSLQSFQLQPSPHPTEDKDSLGKEDQNLGELGPLCVPEAGNTLFVLLLQADVPHRSGNGRYKHSRPGRQGSRGGAG